MPTPAHKAQRDARQYNEDVQTIFDALAFITDTLHELTAPGNDDALPTQEERDTMRETAKRMLAATTPMSDYVGDWEAANGITYDEHGQRHAGQSTRFER